MLKITDVSQPAAMISQAWPNSREIEGKTLRAVETVLDFGFYDSFQTVEVPFDTERKQIGRLIKNGQHTLDYCVSRILNENRLNLSDLDEKNRIASYEKIIEVMDQAREMNASAISFVSGPKPKIQKDRVEALKKLKDSLSHICEAAAEEPILKIYIEPLDVNAHKKGTLGYIHEALDLCQELEKGGKDIWINVDTAHLYLNEEDPIEAVEIAGLYVNEFHFCNCVTEPSHELFGDRHIPFGEPGVLGQNEINVLMQRLYQVEFLNETDRPVLLCEVLKRPQDNSMELLKTCRDVLTQAWESVFDE